MRGRGTLVLLILFLLVAGYALFVERERPSQEEVDEAARVVLDLDPEAITGLRFAWRESTIAAERPPRAAGGVPGGAPRWQLVAPRAVPADDGALDRLAEVFDRLTADRLLEPADLDTVGTGLDDPWVRVTITTGDSARVEHEIAVGRLNATGSAYYARLRGSPRIALLPSGIVEANLERTFTELRDQRVSPFDPEAAERIELVHGGEELVLRVEDGRWRIAAPDPPLDAEESAVRYFLDRLSRLEAMAFADESPAPDLARYGLAPPAAVAEVWGAGGERLARVELGGPAEVASTAKVLPAGTPSPPAPPTPGYYVRGSGQAAVLVVPSAAEADLTPGVVDLRDRRLVDLAGAEIDTLRVIAGDRVAVAARDSAGRWVRLGGAGASGAAGRAADVDMTGGRDPAGAAAAASDPDVERVASNLPHLRVIAFVDDRARSAAELRPFGLDRPAVRLVLGLSNGGRREVRFGGEEPQGVYAHRPGHPGVVLVSASSVEDLWRIAAAVGGGSAAPGGPPSPAGNGGGAGP